MSLSFYHLKTFKVAGDSAGRQRIFTTLLLLKKRLRKLLGKRLW